LSGKRTQLESEGEALEAVTEQINAEEDKKRNARIVWSLGMDTSRKDKI
jgi:hypothetical protein